jgi:coenzyme F420 hydrogenase subunit beta
MTAEWADVSVGMFEGRPGWNTLLIRSQTGADIVTGAIGAGYLETSALPEENLNRLAQAGAAKKKQCLATLRQREVINNGGDRAGSPLRIPQGVAERLLHD